MQTVLNWCNWCRSLCDEVASKFFATNAPGPPYLTLKSCFGVFRSVMVYLGSPRYYMKLGAILVELVQLMQKFVLRSHVRFFSKQSTPLDPKLMFWCVWWCLGAFGIIFTTAWNLVQTVLNWCNWCKSVCYEVASECFANNASGPPHWMRKSCLDEFRSVWVHLTSFRYCTKLGAILAELAQLMQKFMPRIRVRIFSKRYTHWTLNSCFGAFGGVWVHLGSFRFCLKLGACCAELVQLVQKCVVRSCVRIFRKERI